MTFLASHGVLATDPVSIEVTDQIPSEAGPTAAGCYLEAFAQFVDSWNIVRVTACEPGLVKENGTNGPKSKRHRIRCVTRCHWSGVVTMNGGSTILKLGNLAKRVKGGIGH
jgi:hypothetical protein